jgi:hypothetical protein
MLFRITNTSSTFKELLKNVDRESVANYLSASLPNELSAGMYSSPKNE